MLLINAKLVNPPSDFSAFKALTRYANLFLKITVLLEIEEQYFEIYHLWLRNHGMMDYIRDIVIPGDIEGVRIDTEDKFPGTVYITDRITMPNLSYIMEAVFEGLDEYKENILFKSIIY